MEKVRTSFEDMFGIVSKIIGYISMVDEQLLISIFMDLLNILSDQAKLIYFSDCHQQVQLSIALIECAKTIK